jgi:hypothetical protein
MMNHQSAPGSGSYSQKYTLYGCLLGIGFGLTATFLYYSGVSGLRTLNSGADLLFYAVILFGIAAIIAIARRIGKRLDLANEKLGAGFMENFTKAMGTEAAFALNGVSVNGPTWVMAALANNPGVIDSSLQKLVDAFNSELPPEAQDKRIAFGQESGGGRLWSTMKGAGLPFGVTWTYDGGYMVAASERGSAERAIATRNGGSPLVWSPDFLGRPEDHRDPFSPAALDRQAMRPSFGASS